MDSRIHGGTYEIDEKKVKQFFDGRVLKKLKYRYNYTNYNDKHPDIVVERDNYEKSKIKPLLLLNEKSRILDIGCGVGRWADELVSIITKGKYVGIDYSESILEMAKQTHKEKICTWICASFQEIDTVINTDELFDCIIINGVMMYINDTELESCISSLTKYIKTNGRIYIKEPVGAECRLTLKNDFSQEMDSYYSAIYRLREEYCNLFNKIFGDDFRNIEEDNMWPGELYSRKETYLYYWIYERKSNSTEVK